LGEGAQWRRESVAPPSTWARVPAKIFLKELVFLLARQDLENTERAGQPGVDHDRELARENGKFPWPSRCHRIGAILNSLPFSVIFVAGDLLTFSADFAVRTCSRRFIVPLTLPPERLVSLVFVIWHFVCLLSSLISWAHDYGR